jgi:hypothetical protein
MSPQMTPKQKRTFMGFPGTFASLNPDLARWRETQLDMDPMDL